MKVGGEEVVVGVRTKGIAVAGTISLNVKTIWNIDYTVDEVLVHVILLAPVIGPDVSVVKPDMKVYLEL